MSDTDPSAPTTPPDSGAPAAPIDEGTTPEPQPSSGEGTTPPEAPKPGEGGVEPPKAEAGAEGSEEPTPGEGDEPAKPEPPAEGTEPENQTPDLKSMSRAERAQYFQNLESQTRKEAEAQVNEAYQPTPVDELKQKYIDAGHTEFEASMLAREEVRDQEADIAKARAERAELNATLAADAMEVLSTVEWLNPANTEAFDKVSSDAATELYDELCLTRDDNTAQRDANGNAVPGTGQIIGATMTPKQFYGLIDKIRSSGLEGAKLSAQKAAEEQMASVAAPSSNSNKSEPEFDKLTTAQQREKLIASGHLIT